MPRLDLKTKHTPEQKQWPHPMVTGASYSSPQISHLNEPSKVRRPGAIGSGGKSVGSGMSADRKFMVYSF